MNVDAILASIDEQIATLQQVRDVLSSGSDPSVTRIVTVGKKGPGRPKKIAFHPSVEAASVPKKRMMSEEARARIAAAQKKRWAATRKVAK